MLKGFCLNILPIHELIENVFKMNNLTLYSNPSKMIEVESNIVKMFRIQIKSQVIV